MIDSNRQRQALYYSSRKDDASQEFPHGPPSPSGGKYSLMLNSNSFIVIPNVQEHDVMTLRFWLFLSQSTPDDHWKSLVYTKEESTGNKNLEVQLWPSQNRLQFRIKTSLGIETIDTIASLLPRKWYNIAITTINNQNKILIYINGYLDSSSRVLRGDYQTTREKTNYIFGEGSDVKGIEGYIDRVQLYSRELEVVELAPAYAFSQVSKDPFIVHGCQSCSFAEAELVCRSIGSSSLRINDQETNSEYAMCTLEDLYYTEGFNFARMMGWFKPFIKDDDSGTLWVRDLDEGRNKKELERKKIGL